MTFWMAYPEKPYNFIGMGDWHVIWKIRDYFWLVISHLKSINHNIHV